MTTDLIDQYEGGYRQSQVLMTAVRLGVFDAVEHGENTIPALTTALGVDERGIRILCEALVGMELLAKTGERYVNATAAREQLLSDIPGSRCDMVRHAARLYASWGQLYNVVKTGQPADRSGLDPEPAGDPVAFARAMAVVGRRSAGATLEHLDLSAAGTMLDAGGGPGVYACAFAAAYPQLEVTLMDSEPTLAEAARNIAAAGLENRVHCRPGDLHTDPVGDGYDFVLVSNVLHIFSPEQNRALIAKLAAAMTPGGRICIKEFVVNPERTAPAGALLFAVNMLVNTPSGDAYSSAAIRSWFDAAGLTFEEEIPLTPKSALMLARK